MNLIEELEAAADAATPPHRVLLLKAVAALSEAETRIDRLQSCLGDIGDFAHDRSTGPAVPDALWEVRDMAYAGVVL